MPAADVKRREALALLDAGAWDKARIVFLDILQSGGPGADKDSETWFGLSRALAELGNSAECETALSRAYTLAPKTPAIASAVAERLMANGALDQAVKVLKRALFAAPKDVSLLRLLAGAYDMGGQSTAALKACHVLTKIDPGDVMARLRAGSIRLRGRDFAGAEQEFRAALAADPGNAVAMDNLSNILRMMGNVKEARTILSNRAALNGDRASAAIARFKAASTQPVIARSEAEIDEARARLEAVLAAGPEAPIADPFREGLGPNFFLNYQARNDLPLQKAFAAYYLAATPSLDMTAPHVERPVGDRRLRVGILSAYFANHTVGYLTDGLVRGLDRSRFEVVLLRPMSGLKDKETERFRAAARCIDLPSDLAGARAAIAAEELDILHFPEIGMDHFTYFIAFARLATLQTVAWGHPITTGLPHVDLFLSVDDMEPAAGDEHYTEKLVRLKGLSFAGEPPPAIPSNRAEAGLEPGPAYGCLQSLYKVHPHYDEILGRILSEDPDGILYFISNGSFTDALLMERMSHSLGGNASRVRILQRSSRLGFLNLAAAIDVALDVPQWSGGKTSLETFAMGTPIVHMPGEFMRGRHTLGFYRRLGMTAPVAATAEEYAHKAVRLVHDRAFRTDTRAQIAEGQSRLFLDWESIREIENVWADAVRARTS